MVSFHSLEDKIIKYFFSNYSKNKSKPSRYMPDEKNNSFLFEKFNKKVLRPSRDEVTRNNRSRSAKLRYAIRSKNKFIYPNNIYQKFNKYLEVEEINA